MLYSKGTKRNHSVELMAAKDIFHDAVRIALEKEAWIITDDPLEVVEQASCLSQARSLFHKSKKIR